MVGRMFNSTPRMLVENETARLGFFLYMLNPGGGSWLIPSGLPFDPSSRYLPSSL